jgi:guanine deaminase
MNPEFLREAIRLSVEMMRTGRGGPFGAIIVQGNEVIGRGHNQVTASNDPTAHAEVVAIRDACRRLGTFRLDGCDLYTSCEPCPMCLGAIYWARLKRVFFANTRRDATEAGFDDELIYRELALAPAHRAIPFEQGMREEALSALMEWKSKPDKTLY